MFYVKPTPAEPSAVEVLFASVPRLDSPLKSGYFLKLVNFLLNASPLQIL
jgi:hypothetical protein